MHEEKTCPVFANNYSSIPWVPLTTFSYRDTDQKVRKSIKVEESLTGSIFTARAPRSLWVRQTERRGIVRFLELTSETCLMCGWFPPFCPIVQMDLGHTLLSNPPWRLKASGSRCRSDKIGIIHFLLSFSKIINWMGDFARLTQNTLWYRLVRFFYVYFRCQRFKNELPW